MGVAVDFRVMAWHVTLHASSQPREQLQCTVDLTIGDQTVYVQAIEIRARCGD